MILLIYIYIPSKKKIHLLVNIVKEGTIEFLLKTKLNFV